ncbi:MAG: aminotransferase class III-fold pyridoxal phosphate-dependent enzyme [bacterium]|nr:aminotransferase class III-fold pyridoxal phosphate-dependent enzyme [bacterium]
MVTGFRLAFGGAQEFYGVTPDLCATGKVISCGHPLAVVCGRAEIMDYAGPSTAGTSDHVNLTGTYSSNPISAAVALAVIGELKKPGVYEEVERKGNKLKNALTDLLSQAQIPAAVIGEASAFQPWFTKEEVIDHRGTLTADMAINTKFTNLLLDRGIAKGHEKFFISTVHADDEIDYTISALREVVGLLS